MEFNNNKKYMKFSQQKGPFPIWKICKLVMMLFRKMKFMRFYPMIEECRDFLFKFKKKILKKHNIFKNNRIKPLQIKRAFKLLDKVSLSLFLLRKNRQFFKSNKNNFLQKLMIRKKKKQKFNQIFNITHVKNWFWIVTWL